MLSDDNVPQADVVGIMLGYQQTTTGKPRMVFLFDFLREGQLETFDEAVSLCDKNDDDDDQENDNDNDDHHRRRNLYVHRNAFMKVLGATIDFDWEGNKIDPNM